MKLSVSVSTLLFMGLYFSYSSERIDLQKVYAKRIFETNDKGFQVCFRHRTIHKGENKYYFNYSRMPVIIDNIPSMVIENIDHRYDIKGRIIRDNVLYVEETKKKMKRIYKMFVSVMTTSIIVTLFFFFFRITKGGIIYK
ncbi:MAG: hypothetical protein QF876_08500 [Desulfobacterales bacterium]|jgi:hypothetical protein|nr:hypothetical protein [Desulfobacterales bacterium]MDP6806675.1 hypothetical protein [Desulfobacterales bacterium]|tara:strand:+ start:32354 stop:32773 length:420 start_codon:yes stop_codon:yes gene_type:complete